MVPPVTSPGGKPVTARPGLTPRLPTTVVEPVLVTVEPARTAKLSAVPRIDGTVRSSRRSSSSRTLERVLTGGRRAYWPGGDFPNSLRTCNLNMVVLPVEVLVVELGAGTEDAAPT